MKQPLFPRFLVGMLMLFVISVGQVEAQTYAGTGWTLENGTLTITSDEAWETTYSNGFYYFIRTYEFDEYCKDVSAIVIGEGVTYVPDEAFYMRIPQSELSFMEPLEYNASSISISSTVTYIGDRAFFAMYGSGLTVNFASPSQLRELKESVFSASNLTQINLPEGLEKIGYDAFYNTDLVSITLPSTIKRIDDCAFQTCNELTTITCLATTAPSIESRTFDFKGYGSGSSFTTLNIPDHAVGYDQGAWSALYDKVATEHVFHNGFCSADGCAEIQPAWLASDGVYEIGNAGQLVSFARLVNGYDETPAERGLNARLTADIDMSGIEGWIPIGTASCAAAVTLSDAAALTTGIGYQGTFDGQNHCISHLTCRSQSGDVMNHGVFGVLEGTVRRLCITDANLPNKSAGSNSRAGALAGTIYPSGVVEACFAQDCTIGSQDVAGGLIAMNYGGTVRYSYTKNCTVDNSTSRHGLFCADGVNDRGVLPGTFVGCVTEDTQLCGGNRSGVTQTNCHLGTTAEEFASGYVAFLLNDNGRQTSYHQNLGSETADAAPVLDESHGTIYVSGTPGCPNDIAGLTFSNTGSATTIEMPATHPFDNGFCPHCDALQAAERVSTESGSYYAVGNAGQLYWFAGLVNGTLTDGTAQDAHADLRIVADIVDNEGVITEASTEAREWPQLLQYYGNIDGQGHTISGLYCVTPKLTWGDVALIGWYYGSSIQNLGIENSYFTAGSSSECGSFIGYARNECTLTNCYSTAIINGSGSFAGGMAGDGTDVAFTNCYFAGKTNGRSAFSYYLRGINNCYYQEGSGNGSGTVKSAQEFASGDVALALGAEIFGQRVGGETADAFPKFANAGNRLYSLTSYLPDGSSSAFYSNINGAAIASLPTNSLVVTDAAALRDLDNVILRETSAEETVLTCRHLVIADNAPFTFAQPFTAETATFKVSTPEDYVWADGSRGWHHLCAPFSGTLHVDGIAKQSIPSASGTGDYWLKELKGFNADERRLLFDYAASIEAGKPYILALPGDNFGSESMAGGTITIEATDVEMPASASASNTYGGLFFAGTLTGKKALDPDGNTLRYVLNDEGNAFVASYAAVPPFGAYIQGSSLVFGTSKYLQVGQFEGATTHIQTAEESFAEPTDVYDLSGRLVGSRLRNLDTLPAGTYIVNGRKVIKL